MRVEPKCLTDQVDPSLQVRILSNPALKCCLRTRTPALEMQSLSRFLAAAHDRLSLNVIQPLYQLQRLARPAFRAAMFAYMEGMRFRSGAVGWNQDQQREWVLERLRYSVRRAANDTAYYRDLFTQIGFDPWIDFSFDDFAKLPVLEREAVGQTGRGLLSISVSIDQLRPDATGGSTGIPTKILLGPEERGWRESGSEYYMRRIGVPKGTRTGFLWGHHLDPVASNGFGDRLRAFVENIRWFDCFRLSPAVLAQYHMEFEDWQPRCIVAYASGLGALAEEIEKHGWRPSYPTHCFVTGAEKLQPRHRAITQAAFGRPVHERYGGRDVGLMGFQVEPDQSLDFQIDWPNVMIEPETPAVDSAILVTKLHGDGMPMLRYRVGDLGRFPPGSRPGYPTFVLHEVLGREVERIWLPDGRWIHGNQFPHLLKDYPLREFQVVQSADFSVVICVIAQPGLSEESRRGILKTVAANLPNLPVRIQIVANIPRTASNKLRPVISEIDSRQFQLTR